MPKPRISSKEIIKIINLRKTGHTLYEIKNLTKRANGTVWKYIKNVQILHQYLAKWKAKKGGSKAKSKREWKEAEYKAASIIRHISFRDKMLILSCLYWGEGSKAELNLINSDPLLIRTFLVCLKDLGVRDNELKISLRLFSGINRKKAISFWTRTLTLPQRTIQKIDVIKGKKVGKLEYGMCRVRVKKGGKYFKLIISMINLIKSKV